jgi:aryl-alcohol dehydrogenase-like predicted oxidoreductase
VYGSEQVFDALERLVEEQRVAAYGVSVETVEEALTALARPNLASIQIILNPFRQKPAERVLPAAREAGVGVLARVPLASGLLSGKYTHQTRFAADDHRSYNRHGEAFDVGETFSGVDFDRGVEAARDFAALAPTGMSAAQLALRWILDQPGTTSVIPGARTVDQLHANAAAASFPPLDDDVRGGIAELYDQQIRPLVHSRW